MIIALIINIVLLIFGSLFSFLPVVIKLPTIGIIDLDYYFTTGVGYFKFLTQIFPPFEIIAQCAIIYLTWKLTVLGLRVILGHRTPVARE